MAELKNCSCELCIRIGPASDRIRAALTDENLKDFDMLMTRLMHAEDDLDYMNAIWAGTWPGMEWIKEAKAANGYK